LETPVSRSLSSPKSSESLRESIFPFIPKIEQRLEFFFDCLVLYESFGVEGHF